MPEKNTPPTPENNTTKVEPAPTVHVLPVIVFVMSESQYERALAEGKLTDRLMEEIQNAN